MPPTAIEGRPSEFLGCAIPPDLNRRIERAAAAAGSSKSAVVRAALRVALPRLERQAAALRAEMAADD